MMKIFARRNLLMFTMLISNLTANATEKMTQCIFSIPIKHGELTLNVDIGKPIDEKLLKVLSPSLHGEQKSGYEMSVNISGNGNSVVLASRLRVEDGTVIDHGSIVLDAIEQRNATIIALAEGGSLLFWKVGPNFSAFADLPEQWTGLQVRHALSKEQVDVRLGLKADGRATIDIYEPASRRDTWYEEDSPNSFHFLSKRLPDR